MADIIQPARSFEVKMEGDSAWRVKITRTEQTVSVELMFGDKQTATHGADVPAEKFEKAVNWMLSSAW